MRNTEALYWQNFAEKHEQNFGDRGDDQSVYAENSSQHIDADDALAAVEEQKKLFQRIDKDEVDITDHRLASSGLKEFDRRLERSVQALPKQYVRSETIVMEAAFHLIKTGILNIPDVGRVNVKQARALLWNAAWLQEYMNSIWRDQGVLPPLAESSKKNGLDDFALAIMGPGGTGKTAVLKTIHALIDFW